MEHTNKGVHRGFTIVELLVVIVVIAILAAITIVAYNGVTRQSIEATMQTDLKQAASLIDLSHLHEGSYPGTISSIADGKAYETSGDNILTYIKIKNSYCLSVSNPAGGVLNLMSKTGQISEGLCELPNSGSVTTYAGVSTKFYTILGMTIANGRIYIVDAGHRIVDITDPNSPIMLSINSPLGNPSRFAVDSTGNFYVYDMTNAVIYKVTPTGSMSVLAGSTKGYADGKGGSAQFGDVRGLVIDRSGNLYVADMSNRRIRKITPEGVVSTIAGSGQSGFADGTGAEVDFGLMYDLAIDSNDMLYVGDSQRIRKVSPSGAVTTFAGSRAAGNADGTGVAARFGDVLGVTVDATGTVYVADYQNHRIRKITAAGVVTTLAGSSQGTVDAKGAAARFDYPRHLTVDESGALYVVDAGTRTIRLVQ